MSLGFGILGYLHQDPRRWWGIFYLLSLPQGTLLLPLEKKYNPVDFQKASNGLGSGGDNHVDFPDQHFSEGGYQWPIN